MCGAVWCLAELIFSRTDVDAKKIVGHSVTTHTHKHQNGANIEMKLNKQLENVTEPFLKTKKTQPHKKRAQLSSPVLVRIVNQPQTRIFR